ncbi:MAG: tRNA (N6-threonylcarbamoyladenosine(37)-N6)-methyltransferase TrmO [Gemmatimonas sp.]
MFSIQPIGYVRSSLKDPALAPKQAHENAPEAWLEFEPEYRSALRDLRAGDHIVLLTWLDRADRSTLEVHPRDDVAQPKRGVFSTRSADRPNPIGLHRVAIVEIAEGHRVRVDALEAVHGTPILDVKPVLDDVARDR